ncbi:MAG: hypothetical protein RMJ56_13715 [Gemmataceae bacterium]|nr:hypothetical protein [Gemmata sp.]MDW8198649.1 hypothetical protein [Gemmataceae bacterium]
MISRREALTVPTALLFTGGLRSTVAAAEENPTRAFVGTQKSSDRRLRPPKTLNDHFPFVVPPSQEAWELRRQQLRTQLLVANGLWPLPEKTPLNATIHGRIDRDGYTIEKVYFASMPGHYVCGNLYRPAPREGSSSAPRKHPGILFAHGHWKDGRFHDAGEKAAKASVDAKGEPDLDRGRFFMQALPATLARLGFVVFHYDMVGYADSTAIPHREGFRDAAAELRLQSQMGLQTWNSLRALDFLSSLPDVDPQKLGMTGASGGGTQTFILAAIDDRLACVFPAVMVSTAMQGGCVCENCSYLRINTGNVEIAALFAPKPMAFSCANDWTKDFLRQGYPELRQLYQLYDAPERVAAREWLQYGHQYNVHAREFMYSWMLKHLAGKEEKVTEPPFRPVPPQELSVFDDQHPRPKDELDAKALRAAMTKASDEQMARLWPQDAKSLREFRRIVEPALRVMVQYDTLPRPDELAEWGAPERQQQKLPGGLIASAGELGHRSKTGESVPYCLVAKAAGRVKGEVIWVHPQGKISLLMNDKINPLVQQLLEADFRVRAIDPLGIGEHSDEKPFTVDQGYAGYTFGYNLPLLAQRVRDVLLVVRAHTQPKLPLLLVGWDAFGPLAILAKALDGGVITKTAADVHGFDFAKIEKTDDPMMLPGAVKYGGLGAFLALCVPDEVLAYNHQGTDIARISQAAYRAAGAAQKLHLHPDPLDAAQVIAWLVK